MCNLVHIDFSIFLWMCLHARVYWCVTDVDELWSAARIRAGSFNHTRIQSVLNKCFFVSMVDYHKI